MEDDTGIISRICTQIIEGHVALSSFSYLARYSDYDVRSHARKYFESVWKANQLGGHPYTEPWNPNETRDTVHTALATAVKYQKAYPNVYHLVSECMVALVDQMMHVTEPDVRRKLFSRIRPRDLRNLYVILPEEVQKPFKQNHTGRMMDAVASSPSLLPGSAPPRGEWGMSRQAVRLDRHGQHGERPSGQPPGIQRRRVHLESLVDGDVRVSRRTRVFCPHAVASRVSFFETTDTRLKPLPLSSASRFFECLPGRCQGLRKNLHGFQRPPSGIRAARRAAAGTGHRHRAGPHLQNAVEDTRGPQVGVEGHCGRGAMRPRPSGLLAIPRVHSQVV